LDILEIKIIKNVEEIIEDTNIEVKKKKKSSDSEDEEEDDEIDSDENELKLDDGFDDTMAEKPEGYETVIPIINIPDINEEETKKTEIDYLNHMKERYYSKTSITLEEQDKLQEDDWGF
jgi:16S rRNA U516 pseudouridylate synthase RsuA-like enzyme